MYRPNRIGPWPLVNLEAAPDVFTAAEVDAAVVTEPAISIWTPKAVANSSTAAETMTSLENLPIAAGERLGIGVKIIGTQENLSSAEYLLSVGGSCQLFSDKKDINVMFFVGRVNAADNGLQIQRVANVAFIVSQSFGGENDLGALRIDTNMEMVMGNWTPIATPLDDELVAGVLIVNSSAVQNAVISSFGLTISLHRYEGDLDAFDPNR